jgi:hypothetical protein
MIEALTMWLHLLMWWRTPKRPPTWEDSKTWAENLRDKYGISKPISEEE